MDMGLILGIISVAGIPLTLALTMPATTPGEFRFLRWCLIGFGAMSIVALFLVQWGRDWGTLEMKVIVNAVIAAVVVAVVTVGLDWVRNKQNSIDIEKEHLIDPSRIDAAN